jgi:glycosyltransferase involved in cell wall biosynthesis
MTVAQPTEHVSGPSDRFGDEVCVLVPMYNEATAVGAVVLELRQHFNHVVCIDDGSSDGSAAVARLAGATVLRHPVNLGAGAAMRTGFEYVLRSTKVRVAVTCDADGQHRVCDAVRLARRALVGDVDVVLGSRFLAAGDAQVPRARRALLKAATVFTRLTTGLDVTDTHNGLRAFGRHAVKCTDVTLRGMAHASQVLAAIPEHGLTYVEEPVEINYSEYSLAKGQRGLNAFNILCDLAVHQLRTVR